MNNQIIFRSILDKIDQLLESGTPFVAYRKPLDNSVTLMIQQDDLLYYLKNYKQKGFVFTPFDDQEKSILFPLDKCNIYSASISYPQNNLTIEKKENNILNSDGKAKTSYIELVNKGIGFLKEEKVRKVVLSRKETIPIGQTLKSEIFDRLIRYYPQAFVFIYFHPKVGLWIGATPETLISIKGNGFKTMALAGTKLFKEKEHAEWGEKEIEEQQIVTDFIVKQLKDFNLNVTKPFTKKAGGLLHICTEIHGELSSNDQIQTLTHKLHPTPAVCGLPKEMAKSFILKNENYNRAFYTGFFGELNINNTSDLFVNLRCMQIKEQTASLYIGSGITKDSDPISEWEETVSKSEVMKRVLF